MHTTGRIARHKNGFCERIPSQNPSSKAEQTEGGWWPHESPSPKIQEASLKTKTYVASFRPSQIEHQFHGWAHALLELAVLRELVALDLQQQVVQGVALLS